MKASLIGPVNIKKYSVLMNRPIEEIKEQARKIGDILSEHFAELRILFDYKGPIKLVAEQFQKNGGKINMIYTDNDSDWPVEQCTQELKHADVKTKRSNWADAMIFLVSDSDIVLCVGLSAGVNAELSYIKWNYQFNCGNVKTLIGITEMIRDRRFPPEIEYDLKKIIKYSNIRDLDKTLNGLK